MFAASSPVMVPLTSPQQKPTNLLIAPPTIDTLHMLGHLPLEISPWKSCRFQLKSYFLQKSWLVNTVHYSLSPGQVTLLYTTFVAFSIVLVYMVMGIRTIPSASPQGPWGIETTMYLESVHYTFSWVNKEMNEWTNEWMNGRKQGGGACISEWMRDSQEMAH